MEHNPEKVESLRMEIHRRDDLPEVMEEHDLLILRQSGDQRGVFSMFEPEIKKMFGMYFDSLLNYVYTFDT